MLLLNTKFSDKNIQNLLNEYISLIINSENYINSYKNYNLSLVLTLYNKKISKIEIISLFYLFSLIGLLPIFSKKIKKNFIIFFKINSILMDTFQSWNLFYFSKNNNQFDISKFLRKLLILFEGEIFDITSSSTVYAFKFNLCLITDYLDKNYINFTYYKKEMVLGGKLISFIN